MRNAQDDVLGRAFQAGLLDGDRAVVGRRQTAEQLPAADGRAPGNQTEIHRRGPWIHGAAEESRHALADEPLTAWKTRERPRGVAPLERCAQANDTTDAFNRMVLQRFHHDDTAQAVANEVNRFSGYVV